MRFYNISINNIISFKLPILIFFSVWLHLFSVWTIQSILMLKYVKKQLPKEFYKNLKKRPVKKML